MPLLKVIKVFRCSKMNTCFCPLKKAYLCGAKRSIAVPFRGMEESPGNTEHPAS